MQDFAERIASSWPEEHIACTVTRPNIKGVEPRQPFKGARQGYYRGVKIGKPPLPPTRPIEEIREAVRTAFAKHPELLTSN